MGRRGGLLCFVVLFLLTSLTGCRPQAAAGPDKRSEPVTLDLVWSSDAPTMDPLGAMDLYSLAAIENLFVQLVAPGTEVGAVEPEAASSWETSADRQLYTFHLRNDIPWVHHDPSIGETRQVFDKEGRARFVTAEDFVYAFRRVCEPSSGSFYGGVLSRLVVGCHEPAESEGQEGTAEPAEALGVRAADEQTLLIELRHPAPYFLNLLSTIASYSAVPSWTIEEHGEDNWAEAGRIVTNGRFVLHEWTHGQRQTMLRNPLMPADLKGEGNIERVVVRIVPDDGTAYALWRDGEVDVASVPAAEVAGHLQQYAGETLRQEDPADSGVFYVAFINTKPPFDNAQTRRAFSAAIDRETLVNVIFQGEARPMIHLAPPGIFGAPPIDEVGVGFDPGYARDQLAAAGYPNCEGFPQVFLLAYSGQQTRTLAEYLQGQWHEHLGCPESRITIEQQPFNDLVASTEATVPVEEAPHLYILGWGADYRDENNWVGDLLWCGNEGERTRRGCSATDDLIVEAAQEGTPTRRQEMYRQIEEAFFGPEGEMPISPLYMSASYRAVHQWLEPGAYYFLGQWYQWRLDAEAKQAARAGR